MKFMINYSFGDIVLISFPTTTMQDSRKRPALVLIDSDDDLIMARITSQFQNSDYDQRIIEWKAAGLLLPSWVRLHKIATLNKSLVQSKLGSLSQSDFNTIKSKLNNIFRF
jgi:mRNA interferase MazF